MGGGLHSHFHVKPNRCVEVRVGYLVIKKTILWQMIALLVVLVWGGVPPIGDRELDHLIVYSSKGGRGGDSIKKQCLFWNRCLTFSPCYRLVTSKGPTENG